MSIKDHPSNRLHNNEVATFDEALDLVDAEFVVEGASLMRSAMEPEDIAAWKQTARNVQYALTIARHIWHEEQEHTRKRTAACLQEMVPAAEAAQDDTVAEWLDLLATALETQNYSILAI